MNASGLSKKKSPTFTTTDGRTYSGSKPAILARMPSEERLEDPKHTILIAETDEGQVVGYAFAWVISYRNHTTLEDHDSFYIDDICVLNAFQRAGIGRRLFECCKQKAEEQGCKTMELGVWAFQ